MFDKLLEQIEATKLADKILEKYKRVETDESYVTSVNKSVETPVATLADEYGGRSQIGVDDGCYVLYLIQEDGTYKRTAWIFPEAHDVLRDLPDLMEARKKYRIPDRAKCKECGRIFDLTILRQRIDYEPGVCPLCGGNLTSMYESKLKEGIIEKLEEE